MESKDNSSAAAVKSEEISSENFKSENSEGEDTVHDVNLDQDLAKISEELTLSLNEEDPEEEDDDDDEDEVEGDGEDKKGGKNNTCVKVQGFTRSGKPNDDYIAWYKFFKDDVQIEVPLIQNPGSDDLWFIFKMRSLVDKHKLFQYVKNNKFNGNKIQVKTIPFREHKKMVPLTQEEAIELLYPGRNVLYTDQLKNKFTKIKCVIEEHMMPVKSIEKYTKIKKYLRNVKTQQVVPMTPIDGYENNVIIHVEKNSADEVIVGLRVVDQSKTKTTIVPLDKCLSVPRQMTLVSKGIISELTACGLEPYSPTAMTGEVLGLILRISEQGTFMLTVIMKKPDNNFFELTSEGIGLKEGEETKLTSKELMAKQRLKLINFYETEGGKLGIQSVLMIFTFDYVLLTQSAEKVWSNLPRPEHVMGDRRIMEKINGVDLRVPWDRERHIESYKSILNLFDPFNFNSNTTIYLVSPIRQIGYYFAKRCGYVIQIGYWTQETNNRLRLDAKKDGLKNIEYFNFNFKLKGPASDDSVVVWWPILCTASNKKDKKIIFLEQFLNFKFTSMVFVSYWISANANFDHHRRHIEKVYSKLKVNDIIPFDTEPYKDGLGLFLYFKGLLGDNIGMSNDHSSRMMSNNRNSFQARNANAYNNPFQNPRGPGERAQDVMGKLGQVGRPMGQVYSPWEEDRRQVAPQPRRVSAMDRLNQQRHPDYQANRYLQPSTYDNSPSQMEIVAGVVQNLQSMAQQMQVLVEQNQQDTHCFPSWFNNRTDGRVGWDDSADNGLGRGRGRGRAHLLKQHQLDILRGGRGRRPREQ